MVVSAVKVETSLRLEYRIQGPPHVLKVRLQERERSRKRCLPVERTVWQVHVRLVSDPYRQVDDVARVLASLSREELRRRHPRVSDQAGGLQAWRHRKLQCHSDPALDHPIMFMGADGSVLAPNAVVVEHRHELRYEELGAVIRAKVLHGGRATLGVDVGQETS